VALSSSLFRIHRSVGKKKKKKASKKKRRGGEEGKEKERTSPVLLFNYSFSIVGSSGARIEGKEGGKPP